MYFTWFLHPEFRRWGGCVNAKTSTANLLFSQIVPKKCMKLRTIYEINGFYSMGTPAYRVDMSL